MEKLPRFPGGEKSAESCHVSGCHGFVGAEAFSHQAQQGVDKGWDTRRTVNADFLSEVVAPPGPTCSLTSAPPRLESPVVIRRESSEKVRKIRAPIKIKSALPPPNPPPPKKGNFTDMVFPAERRHFSRCP